MLFRVKRAQYLPSDVNLSAGYYSTQKATESQDDKQPMCIMACGLSGSGKSTLLNGICGTQVFQVGHLAPTATKVKKHPVKRNLILCEVPGFEEKTDSEDAYLEEIRRECTNVDTLLYCIPVDAPRIRMKSDQAILQKLHSALDPKVWNSCIIVFTFANSLVDKIKVDVREPLDIEAGTAKSFKEIEKHLKQEYCESIKMWKEKVLETFRRAGIDPSKMPIVEAGEIEEPMLFSTDEKPWMSTFIETIRAVLPPDGQGVLNNIKYPTRRAPLPQPVYRYNKAEKSKLPAVLAGIVGALLGVAVAALFGGIPTALGGVLGAIGGVIGMIAYGTVVQKKKDK